MRIYVILLAVIFGVLHSLFINKLFENDKTFSLLSTMERELSFRTEMGFYYSFYKEIVYQPNIREAITNLLQNNHTEYPKQINALKRFNIYPELFIGMMYRILNYTTFSKSNKFIECWWINRAEMPSVKSCIGIGDPIYFYVYCVIALSGLTAFSLFLIGYSLSDSVWGGLITTACFYFNHSEATRVQWTIPLRESFGYPLFVAQTLILILMMKSQRNQIFLSILYLLLSIMLHLSWQFMPFIMFTQVVCLVCTYLALYQPFDCYKNSCKDTNSVNDKHKKIAEINTFSGRKALFLRFFCLQMISLIVAWILLFFNPSLLISFHCSSIVIGFIAIRYFEVLAFKKLDKTQSLLTGFGWKTFYALFYISLTIGMKALLSIALNYKDDNHVYEILLNKFSNYRTIHTMLYTCSAEFNFLAYETYRKLFNTGLLPLSILSITIILFKYIYDEKRLIHLKQITSIADSKNEQNGLCNANKTNPANKKILTSNDLTYDISPEAMFTLLQTVIFCILAMLIMRLKLFGTPHLCIIVSMLANKKIYPKCISKHLFKHGGKKIENSSKFYFSSCMILILSITSYHGIKNIKKQLSMHGEYMNIDQEDMMNWILERTPKDKSFAGPMSVMANIKLSTGRPIINHPHYEDANLREITEKVYTLFSRKPLEEVHAILLNLSVHYAVVEDNWCFYQASSECTLPAIWDFMDPDNKRREPVCSILRHRAHNEKLFKTVYENPECTIVKILKKKRKKY